LSLQSQHVNDKAKLYEKIASVKLLVHIVFKRYPSTYCLMHVNFSFVKKTNSK